MRPLACALSLVAVTTHAWAQADMSIKGCRSNLDCPLDPSSGSEEACCCTAPYDFQIPGTYAQCQFTAICDYPIIQGSCCCPDYFDGCPSGQCDAWTQLVNVYNNPSDPYGMFAAPGDCVPPPPGSNGLCARPPTCGDTELTDDYYNGVNLRTGCAVTAIQLGRIENGALLALDASIIFNEGRPPPAELNAGADANNGLYGVGGWASFDRIFTDEGVYWDGSGTIHGARGDRNGNGYVGYTLHTPLGSRTYDYPLVVKIAGFVDPVAVYRSEPFDGQFLRVMEARPGQGSPNRAYVLFHYPSGMYEFYDWPLSSPRADARPQKWDPTDPVRAASLLTRAGNVFGPPDLPFRSREIRIRRGSYVQQSTNDAKEILNFPADSTATYTLDFARMALPDGGLRLSIVRSLVGAPPQWLTWTVSTSAAKGFHPATYTRPGRQRDDVITLDWDSWKIKTIDITMQDKAMNTIYEDLRSVTRATDGNQVASVVSTETVQSVPTGDRTYLFERCGLDGKPFDASVAKGITVSMPGNLRQSFEYGDATANNRLLATTDVMGIRTQYRYNDASTEPRGELTDVVMVPMPTPAAMLQTGLGSHLDWDLKTQNAMDATLFPNDTFVNQPAASRGVPVTTVLTRRPDNLAVATMSDFDTAVFQPKTIVDRRGFTRRLTYYADTGQLKSETTRGVTTDYTRTIEDEPRMWLNDQRKGLMTIETKVTGLYAQTIDKTTWDVSGRLAKTTKTGHGLSPTRPTTGFIIDLTIEKLMQRGGFFVPGEMQTYVNRRLTGRTGVGWDQRLQGPASSTSSLTTGGVLSSLASKGGTVDGLGSMIGDWQVTGSGQGAVKSVDLDPVGDVTRFTNSGVGERITYSAGPDARSLKMTMSALSRGNAPVTQAEMVDSAGTTMPVCK